MTLEHLIKLMTIKPLLNSAQPMARTGGLTSTLVMMPIRVPCQMMDCCISDLIFGQFDLSKDT